MVKASSDSVVCAGDTFMVGLTFVPNNVDPIPANDTITISFVHSTDTIQTALILGPDTTQFDTAIIISSSDPLFTEGTWTLDTVVSGSGLPFSINTAANSIELIVNHVATGSITPGDTTIVCASDTVDFQISGYSADGDATYEWQWLPSAGSAVSPIGNDSVSISHPIDSSGAVIGVVTSTLESLVCSDRDTVQILVNKVSAHLLADKDTICKGDTLTLSLGSSLLDQNASISFSWQWLPKGGSSIIPIGTDTTINHPFNSNGAVTGVVTSTLGGAVCSDTDTAEIVVNAISVGSLAQESFVVCTGDTISLAAGVVDANAGASLAYLWQSSSSDTLHWQDLFGSSGDTLVIVSNNDSLFRYRVLSTLGTVQCSTGVQDSILLEVNSVSLGKPLADTTVCTGADVQLIATAQVEPGANPVSIVWESRKDSSSTSWQPRAKLDLGEALSLTNIHGDSVYQYWAESTLDGTVCISETSKEIYVSENRVNPGAISGDTTICNGLAPGLFVEVDSATADGALSYLWESSSDRIEWDSVGMKKEYGASSLTQDTFFRRIVISDLKGTFCGTVSRDTIEVSVIDGGDPGKIVWEKDSLRDLHTVCQGESAIILLGTPAIPDGAGSVTYQWQWKVEGGSWGDLGTETSQDLSLPAFPDSGSFAYRRVAIFAPDSEVCKATSDTITFQVKALPPTPVISRGDPNGSVCSNTGGVEVKVDTVFPAYEHYQWYTEPTTNISGANSSHAYVDVGANSLAVQLEVETEHGCVSRSDLLSLVPSGDQAPQSPVVLQGTRRLICLDGSFTSYQWGWIDKESGSVSRAATGEVFQDWIVPDTLVTAGKLDTARYEYWVKVSDGTCHSRLYYNRNAIQSVSLPGPTNLPDLALGGMITISPNPVSDRFRLAWESSYLGPFSLRLMNLQGKVVYAAERHKRQSEYREDFTTAALPPGLYMLTIFPHSAGPQALTQKIQLQ